MAADAPDATPAEAASPDEPAEAEPADAPPAPVLDLPRETDAEGTEGRAG